MTASRPQAGPGAAGQIIITFLAKTRSRASLQPSAKVGSQPAAQVAAGATPETIGRPNKSCPERRGCRRTFAQRQRRTHQAKACKCFTAAGHAQQARNQAKRKNGVCSLLPRLQLRLHLLQAAQDLLSRAHTRSGRAAQQPARAGRAILASCVISGAKRGAARARHLKVWPLLGPVGHALVHQLRKGGRRVRGQPQAALPDGDRDDDLRAVHAAPGALARPHLPAQHPECVRVCAGAGVSAPADRARVRGEQGGWDRRPARQARAGAQAGEAGALTAGPADDAVGQHLQRHVRDGACDAARQHGTTLAGCSQRVPAQQPHDADGAHRMSLSLSCSSPPGPARAQSLRARAMSAQRGQQAAEVGRHDVAELIGNNCWTHFAQNWPQAAAPARQGRAPAIFAQKPCRFAGQDVRRMLPASAGHVSAASAVRQSLQARPPASACPGTPCPPAARTAGQVAVHDALRVQEGHAGRDLLRGRQDHVHVGLRRAAALARLHEVARLHRVLRVCRSGGAGISPGGGWQLCGAVWRRGAVRVVRRKLLSVTSLVASAAASWMVLIRLALETRCRDSRAEQRRITPRSRAV